MKKPALIIGAILLVVVGIVAIKALKKPATQKASDNTPIELPLNTLPLSERPYITLAPDSTGRSLDLTVAGAPTTTDLEYELIYQADGKQEGAIGTLYLKTEKQPLTKSILLGSKSGGGKVTYHEGVTGGSFTVTYGLPAQAGETRLKESWNFLKFNPLDPTISSTDGKFSVTLDKTALKKDQMIIIMKSFGYPQLEGKVVAGPYHYSTQTPVKGNVTVSIKLPAGEHVNPTLYGYDGKTLPAQAGWSKLTSKLSDDTVTATTTSSFSTFLVTAE